MAKTNLPPIQVLSNDLQAIQQALDELVRLVQKMIDEQEAD